MSFLKDYCLPIFAIQTLKTSNYEDKKKKRSIDGADTF